MQSSQLFVCEIKKENFHCTEFLFISSGNGIYHGVIKVPSKRDEDIAIEAKLLVIPVDIDIPKHIFMTHYHFIIFSADNKLDIVNKFTGEKIGQYYSKTNILGLRFDVITQQLYLFNENSVNQISLLDEERLNWCAYLIKALASTKSTIMFEDDLYKSDRNIYNNNQIHNNPCQHSSNSTYTDIISYLASVPLSLDETLLRAINMAPLAFELFLRGQHIKQNIVYTPVPVLSFINNSHSIHTISTIFLKTLFARLSTVHSYQRTMISTWLCENYLHEVSLKLINHQLSIKYNTTTNNHSHTDRSTNNNDNIHKVVEFLRTNRYVLFH